MKLLFGGVLTLLLVLFGGVVPVGASANDFSFSQFEADYYLGVDNEGRSTLKVVEKLVAVFPSVEQNHGIERAIPVTYDGHTLKLEMRSIRDGNGNPMHYKTFDEGDHRVFRIGDPDKYVHGQQQYEITYTMRDVTKAYADTGKDEFYWDVNGTHWRQTFGVITARLHIDSSLQSKVTNNMSCYWGVQGATNKCDITRRGDIITASVSDVGARENMTIAVGFQPGTFMPYQPTFFDKLFMAWIILLIISSIIAVGILIWLGFRYYNLSNRVRELEPIATEYVPPADASVLLSSHIAESAKASATAQLIDLAVRHYIAIKQVSEKSLWKQAEYELEIVKPTTDLFDEEVTFLRTMFGSNAVGTTITTKQLKSNYTIASTLYKNTQALTKHIKSDYGYRHEDKAVSDSFKRIGKITGSIGVVTVSPLLFIAGLTAYVCGVSIRPLTDKGLDLRRYLAGLKRYIAYAEADRIKELQSPEGAAKTGVQVKGENDKKLIKLYERTLPYAVLFGHEKEWNKQLAVYYENHNASPDWYTGVGAFNAAAFTSAMSDVGGTLNSYGTSSSSSSGGSSGGGSSGGGGGGGGGGGW